VQVQRVEVIKACFLLPITISVANMRVYFTLIIAVFFLL